MTRRYDRMRFPRDERINWSLEELKELVNNKNSQVHVLRTKKHIALYPYHLTNLKKSLHEILADEINRYNHELKGLLLAYKNPKLLSPVGAIFYDTPFIHVDVEADFYVFKPEIDSVLKGIINKKAANHIGVLVHKVFNVSIPKEDEEDENWRGHHYDVGDEVKFTVKHMDFKGRLPFIRGTLMSSEDDVNGTSTKNSKKHKFTDEDLDLNDEDPPENPTNNNVNNSKVDSKKFGFLASINNASSSESEDEFANLKKSSGKNAQALNGRKKIIDNTKTAETSSDDSESEVEVSCKIPERESSKKLSKKNPEKSVLNNSSKNGESSESSSSQIKAESPKKSKKHKLDSAEERENDSNELPEKIPRKRKHSEPRNPDDTDEHSTKIEKSKKSKKSSAIDESFEQKSPIKEKIKREKEILDKSIENEKWKEEKKSKRETKEDKKDRKHKKKLEEEVDAHFLPLKKIKVEEDDENIPKPGNSSKRNERKEETLDNPSNDASNHEDSTSVPKKPKKKKKHRRDEDSIDALMNVSIKDEEKILKKTKKSRKQETIEEEVENEVGDRIKKEKDDVMSIKSPRILNLLVDDSDSDETSEVKLEIDSRKIEKPLNSPDKPEVKTEDDTSRRKKSKKNKSSDKDDEARCSKKIKNEKEKSKRKKSKNIEEVKDDGASDSHEFLTPTVKSEKSRGMNASRCSDDNGELSDASLSRSRILIKKEESVFFGNIKIKQEPYPSDVEFLASKKRQRVQEDDSSDKNNGIEKISIKDEEIFVKSEECVKTKKIKNENSENSIVKDENVSSNNVKSKKKSKTTFSE